MSSFQLVVNEKNFTVDVVDQDGDMVRVDTELDRYVAIGTANIADEATARIVPIPERAVDAIIATLQAWKARQVSQKN